jgi:hypothetical protein
MMIPSLATSIGFALDINTHRLVAGKTTLMRWKFVLSCWFESTSLEVKFENLVFKNVIYRLVKS